MRREIRRERRLPAFKIDLGQLEALLARLTALFPGQSLDQSITVSLKDQEISFDSPDEIRTCPDLPARVTSFRVHLSKGFDHQVFIKSEGPLGDGATVTAYAATESWCAGIIETVCTFLQAHRQWHWWFRDRLGVPALLSLNLSVPLLIVGLKPSASPALIGAGWVGAVIALFGLYLGRNRMFPSGILQVGSYETTVRMYMPELTLVVAVVALILTILGWFLGG